MDKELFRLTCKRFNDEIKSSPVKGIGTLGEKTLHSILKHYFEPDARCHEKPIEGFVADIVTSNGIIEIQTRNFNALRKKLACFLAWKNVTIIYPVAKTKWLLWIDEVTGEITKKRKSPKTGRPYEAFYELYKIKNLLPHPNLCICIVLVDLEEYRYLNGWSEDRKKGSTRYDRIPVDIAEEIYIRRPEDYAKLIPEALESSFTSKEYKSSSGLSLASSQTALNVLHSVGAVVRTGKRGNSYVYSRRAMP